MRSWSVLLYGTPAKKSGFSSNLPDQHAGTLSVPVTLPWPSESEHAGATDAAKTAAPAAATAAVTERLMDARPVLTTRRVAPQRRSARWVRRCARRRGPDR